MATIPNIGLDLGFSHSAIRRMMFCATLNNGGTANVVTLTNAGLLAAWKTLFNQQTHDGATVDPSTKVVCSPLVREFTKADVDATYWEVEDYKVKMRNGTADITCAFLDPAPYVLANLAELEDYTISVYFIDEESKVIGIKDGSNLNPIPIKVGSFSVPFYSPRGYTEGSRNTISFRLDAGSDMNKLVGVTIATADVYDSTDFYSMRDCSCTISSPAVTGCVFSATVDDVDPEAPGTSIPLTGIVYGEIKLVDQAAPYTIKSLAAAGSLVESPAGTYTINESNLLTTVHTYTLQICHDVYDVIPTNSCIVP